MKLWRISQDVNGEYDTYDSAVVAAESEQEAREITPSSYGNGWVAVEHVKAEYIGTAKRGTKAGVILASFNAG